MRNQSTLPRCRDSLYASRAPSSLIPRHIGDCGVRGIGSSGVRGVGIGVRSAHPLERSCTTMPLPSLPWIVFSLKVALLLSTLSISVPDTA
eukprot:3555822-Rhodomonas_salina.2